MASRKEALSPLKMTPCGPERLRLASTLSSFSEDRHLAKTASPEMAGGGGGGGGGGRGNREGLVSERSADVTLQTKPEPVKCHLHVTD